MSLDQHTALRREWGSGLSNLWRFIGGSGGLDSAMEAMFALAGPTVEREFAKFAGHPVGQKLLAQSPRPDLNALLSDHAILGAMPRGSFADAYLVYMGDVGMAPAAAFLQAAGLDEKAERFGWTDDQLWFVNRMANSHDLFHVLGGYDRTITGEVGVDAYTAGHIQLIPIRLMMLYFLMLKPSEPIGWPRYVMSSYRHGRDTPSLFCVDYEAALPLPLDEARRRIGIPSFDDAHPHGVPLKGRTLDRIERRIEGR
jgi:ubiquinone biosynthesis protein COQ4